jgi:type VI secretion system protein
LAWDDVFLVNANVVFGRCGAALLLAVLIAGGCSALRRPLLLRVHVAPRANQDRPLAVDLVATSDKRLGELLAKTPAAEWFTKRAQFERDYPRQGALEVQSWEWVPGQVVYELEIPLRSSAKAIFLFARYANGGDHRARLEPMSVTTVTLGEQEMAVQADRTGRKAWPKR